MRCALYRSFFFKAEDGIRYVAVTGVQTCALPIFPDAQAPALPDLLERLLDGREAAHHAPFTASDRCTYLPITSVSMLTACPAASRPRVGPASVCGISITSKAASSRAATLRLTPSTATEPCVTS